MNINFSKPAAALQGRTAFRNPFVEIGLLVIISLLLVWFVILPKKNQGDEKRRELTKIKEEQKLIAGKLDTLRELAKSLQSHQNEIADLDKALPLDGKSLRLNLLIDAFARSSGVTLGNINLSGKPNGVVAGDKDLLKDVFAPKRELQKLSGTVYVIGSLNQLTAFLRKLETSGRLIDVTDLSLDSGTEGNLNMKLSITAYYFAP